MEKIRFERQDVDGVEVAQTFTLDLAQLDKEPVDVAYLKGIEFHINVIFLGLDALHDLNAARLERVVQFIKPVVHSDRIFI